MQMQGPPSHHRAASTSSAPAQHFMSQEQAENVKQMLQQIDEQMIRNAQRMSARTHSHHTRRLLRPSSCDSQAL